MSQKLSSVDQSTGKHRVKICGVDWGIENGTPGKAVKTYGVLPPGFSFDQEEEPVRSDKKVTSYSANRINYEAERKCNALKSRKARDEKKMDDSISLYSSLIYDATVDKDFKSRVYDEYISVKDQYRRDYNQISYGVQKSCSFREVEVIKGVAVECSIKEAKSDNVLVTDRVVESDSGDDDEFFDGRYRVFDVKSQSYKKKTLNDIFADSYTGREYPKPEVVDSKPFFVISPTMDKFGTSKAFAAPLIHPSELNLISEDTLSMYPDWFTEEDIRKDLDRKEGFDAFLRDNSEEDLFGDSSVFIPFIGSDGLVQKDLSIEKDWCMDDKGLDSLFSSPESSVKNLTEDGTFGDGWITFDDNIKEDVDSVVFTNLNEEWNIFVEEPDPGADPPVERSLGEIFGDMAQEFHLPGGSRVKKKGDSFDRLFFDSDVVIDSPLNVNKVIGVSPTPEHEIMRTLMWRDGVSIDGDPNRDISVRNWSLGSFPYFCSKISAPPELDTELDRYMSRYDRAKVLMYNYSGSYLNRTSSFVQLITWVSPVLYTDDSLTRKDLCRTAGWSSYKVYDVGPNSEIEFKGSFNPSGFFPITTDDSCFWLSPSVSSPLTVYLNFALVGFHKWPSDVGLCMFESLHLMKFSDLKDDIVVIN
jgi:hypothetical protein